MEAGVIFTILGFWVFDGHLWVQEKIREVRLRNALLKIRLERLSGTPPAQDAPSET